MKPVEAAMNYKTYRKRETWLAARKRGIGGSDAPVVMGTNSYKSRLELWAEKVGDVPDRPAGEAAEWGNRLEPVVLQGLQDRTGREVLHQKLTIVQHPEAPHMLCSPDAFQKCARRGWGVVQAKTTSAWMAEDWKDSPPLTHQVQIQHEMDVCGLDWGTLCVLIGGQRFAYFDVERNERFVNVLRASEHAFWDLVVNRIRPEIDDSESCRRTVAELWPEDSGETVVLPQEALDWDAELVAVKEQLKLLEAAKQRLETQIKAEIGDATWGVLPSGQRYSLKTTTRKPYEVKESTFRALRRLKGQKS